jgi:hypothetical protein
LVNLTPSSSDSRRRWVRVACLLATAALLLVLGYQSGLRSPWNAHHPYLVDGEATRYGKDAKAVIERDDGTHLWVGMNGVVWKSGRRTGEDGIPPCLRKADATAAVQVGVIDIDRPYGSGSYPQVLWLTCL